MLSNEDINVYTDLYFNYGFNIKNDLKSYEFPSLVKFLIQWRRDEIKRDDPLFINWISIVAPSCVYKQTLFLNNKEENTFVCFYCDSKVFKRSASLIRHYKESHIEVMPANIFGESVTYKCDDCNLEFTRKEYLTSHKQSEKHLKIVDPEALSKKRLANSNSLESDNFYKKTKLNQQNLIRESETDNFSSASVSANSNVEIAHIDKNSPIIIQAKEKLIKIGLYDHDHEDDKKDDDGDNDDDDEDDDDGEVKEIFEITNQVHDVSENQENDNLNGTQPIESETLNHTPNVTLNDLNNSHSQGIARNDSKTNKSGNKLVKVLSTNLENVLKF